MQEAKAKVRQYLMDVWKNAHYEQHLSDSDFAEVMLMVLLEVVRKPE